MLGDAIAYCRRRLEEGAEGVADLAYIAQELKGRIDESARAWNDERARLLRDHDLQPHVERADAQLAALRRALEACEAVMEPLSAAAAQDEVVGAQVIAGHQAAQSARSLAADAHRSAGSAAFDIDSAQSGAARAMGMVGGL